MRGLWLRIWGWGVWGLGLRMATKSKSLNYRTDTVGLPIPSQFKLQYPDPRAC